MLISNQTVIELNVHEIDKNACPKKSSLQKLKLNWWINHKKENLVNDVQNSVTIIANLKICNLATKSEDKRTADNYRESPFINYFIIDVQ